MEIVTAVITGSLLLIGLVAFLIIRNLKKGAWEGELLEKKEVEMSGGGDFETTSYALFVRTTTGVQKRVYVPQKLYDRLSVGDQLIKRKGETYPKKADTLVPVSE